jgi:RNA polymerase sigma-70 factor (ECF subfamily)
MKTDLSTLQTNPSDYPYELIEGCKSGDQKAQLKIYKLYYKSIFNLCLQIVNDPAEAEHLMHESFLLAFENIGSYNGDISISSWIKTFIRHIY